MRNIIFRAAPTNSYKRESQVVWWRTWTAFRQKIHQDGYAVPERPFRGSDVLNIRYSKGAIAAEKRVHVLLWIA